MPLLSRDCLSASRDIVVVVVIVERTRAKRSKRSVESKTREKQKGRREAVGWQNKTGLRKSHTCKLRLTLLSGMERGEKYGDCRDPGRLTNEDV